MYAWIEGIPVLSNANRNILFLKTVSGVCYELHINERYSAAIEHTGQAVTMWTYLSVKENSLTLWGFPNKNERDLFELLLTVERVGCRTAMNLLVVAEAEQLAQAIRMGNTKFLCRASGISEKTASNIILALAKRV